MFSITDINSDSEPSYLRGFYSMEGSKRSIERTPYFLVKKSYFSDVLVERSYKLVSQTGLGLILEAIKF